MGAAKRSLGNVTLQHYRGRTIAKKKITANPAYIASSLQVKQRNIFKYASNICQQVRTVTSLGFSRTMYGSQYNAWMKQNMPAFQELIGFFAANNPDTLPTDWVKGRQYIMGGIEFMRAMYENVVNVQSFYIASGISIPLVYNWTVSNATGIDKVQVLCDLSIPDAGYKTVYVQLMAIESDVTSQNEFYTAVPTVHFSAVNKFVLKGQNWETEITNPFVQVKVGGSSDVVAFVKIDGKLVDIPANVISQTITAPVPDSNHTAALCGAFARKP